MDPKSKAIAAQQLHDEIQLQRFKEAYIRLGVAWKAYKELHPNCTDESARVLGSRTLARVNMTELMEELGATDAELGYTLRLGYRNASKRIPAKQLKYFDNEKKQEVTETVYIDVPDYAVRERYARTALEVKKKLGGGEQNTTQIGQMNFVWGNSPQNTPTTQPQQPIIEGQTVDKSR